MTGGGRTMAEVLDQCRPSITGGLIDPARLAQLDALCARLPLQFSAFWGLECRLADPEPRVDLLFEIKRDSARHHLLAGDGKASGLDELCEAYPAWAALRAFARAWRDDPRGTLVANVWVELDLVAADHAAPPRDALAHPSIFWGPDRTAVRDWTALDQLLAFAAAAYPPFPAVLPRNRIEQAVRRLPEEARVFQLGAMQSRGDVMLRMCVNRFAPGAMAAWLRELDWPGDAAALDDALRPVAAMAREVTLDVDFTADGLGAKIGLECYQEWPALDVAQWQGLVDHARALGLARDEKAAAVLAWPAETRYTLRQQYDGQHDGHMFPVVFRNIHHIKLAFVNDAMVEAKAYLGVTRPGFRIGFPMRTIPDGEPEEWLSA